MANYIPVMVLITLLVIQPFLAQAQPVDVNADGLVGPHEVIDLAENWKGPALQQGGLQPWQVNGATIFYNDGNVGIGTPTPDTKLHVMDGRIRLGNSQNSNRWDLFQTNNGDLFKIEQNAAFSNFVIVGGAEGRVGIGTETPAANTKLHVLSNTLNSLGVYSEVNGSMSSGVYGKTNTGSGVYGIADSGYGVYGVTTGGIGVAGRSNTNYGVEGTSADSWGVSGVSTNSIGVSGSSLNGTGVDGYSGGATGTGVKGVGATGVVAISTSGWGLIVDGGATFVGGEIVSIEGNLLIDGDITELKSTVQIDHPLDPANKILSHSSVESPDMMNIYNGNATTDATGYAAIMLPDYFEPLNKDFRYQLTVIGDFAQAVVSKEIENNAFEVKTDKPNVKVSWMVTGIRQDAYAKANPMEVEREKSEAERGKYLTPEVYGQPKEMGIGYRPEMDLSSRTASKVE